VVTKWTLRRKSISTSLLGKSREEKGAVCLSESFRGATTVTNVASQWVLILHYLQERAPAWLSRYRNSIMGGRSGHRIPVGARFSAPGLTGLGTHPASHAMVTGSLLTVKRPRYGVNHSLHLALRLMKE